MVLDGLADSGEFQNLFIADLLADLLGQRNSLFYVKGVTIYVRVLDQLPFLLADLFTEDTHGFFIDNKKVRGHFAGDDGFTQP